MKEESEKYLVDDTLGSLVQRAVERNDVTSVGR